MREIIKDGFLQRLYRTSPLLLRQPKIHNLVKIYQDLEKTLKSLRQTRGGGSMNETAINIRKLILQLTISKRRLERKIGNTLLLEKQHLKRRIRAVTSSLKH